MPNLDLPVFFIREIILLAERYPNNAAARPKRTDKNKYENAEI
jgi:hypothetical protein